jgi:hypothetical protein
MTAPNTPPVRAIRVLNSAGRFGRFSDLDLKSRKKILRSKNVKKTKKPSKGI